MGRLDSWDVLLMGNVSLVKEKLVYSDFLIVSMLFR